MIYDIWTFFVWIYIDNILAVVCDVVAPVDISKLKHFNLNLKGKKLNTIRPYQRMRAWIVQKGFHWLLF